MNIRRIATSIVAAAAIVIGGAATASANTDGGARTWDAPSGGCGALAKVTTFEGDVALYSLRTCEQDVFEQDGLDPHKFGTYKAPTQKVRKAKRCGRLLAFTVLPGKAATGLFRYEGCDISAKRGAVNP